MTPAVKYGQVIEYIPGKYTRFSFGIFTSQLPMERLRVLALSTVPSLPLFMHSLLLLLLELLLLTFCLLLNQLTYIDRLYLASYTTPPTEDTIFPYPDQQPVRRSPGKRSARAGNGPAVVLDKDRAQPYYFTIDDTLLYNAFHHDFGPLHIGHLYRFAVQFHDILGAPENKNKPVVFWSKADARSE